MTLLADGQLIECVFPKDGTPSLVDGITEDELRNSKESPIQASSVDLKIGSIYIPGTKENVLGGIPFGLAKYTLRPGATVIIESRETLNIPSNLAGIGFPPASVAVKGLLMTNAGHIDPGYNGKLSFTVINMGKEDYILVAGEKVFSILFFQLSKKVSLDISERNGGKSICGGVRQHNLDVLNRDFLDIENRAKKAVIKYSGYATAILLVVVNVITGFMDRHNGVELERRLSQMEAKLQLVEAGAEIDQIKNAIMKMENKLKLYD